MERAAVLIGVKQSGRLPRLRAVDDGVRRMHRWALDQGIPETSIEILTDEGGEVRTHEVFDAVRGLVERATVEQLLVYFAGHGVNNGYSEYWLLSDAPENPNEAVNVAGSVVLAERSGIPHVVLVSDACRTRPDSISALSVTGSEMFPNQPPAGPAASVDVFYACLLGDPAAEFGDPEDAAAVFRSVYTEVLLEALEGGHPDLIERVSDGSDAYDVVRPWPLKEGLPPLVRDRIVAEDLWRKISQTPDARVTSNPNTAWIARHRPGRSGRAEPTAGAGPGGLPPTPGAAPSPTLQSLVNTEIHRSVDPGVDLDFGFAADATPDVDGGDEFSYAAETLAEAFGPAHYESDAGFKVRGAQVVEAIGAGVDVELLDAGLVRIWGIDAGHPGASVLMRFSSGSCAVLPAVFQYMCGATLAEGRLVDVSYEPMDTSPRWDAFRSREREIRRARSTLAAASRIGRASLDRRTASATAQYLQSVKGLDPSSAVYAAYTYRDLGDHDLLGEMADYQFDDLGVVLFDLELLVGRPPPSSGSPQGRRLTLPFFPMLSRGWALVNAFGATLHPSVIDPGTRIPSLWTLFTSDAYAGIAEAMETGDVR